MRSMLETKNMSLSFGGHSTGEEVTVVLPPLDHILKEGDYNMTLEVVVDDRYFEPLQIVGQFEKRLKVTAESVQVKTKPIVTTTASLVEVKKPKRKVNAKINNNSIVQKENPVKPQQEKIKKLVETSKKSFSDKDIMNLIDILGKKK